MKAILVPCDFSTPALHAFKLALDIAQQAHAVIHLLNVVELPVMHDTTIMPVLSVEQQLVDELHATADRKLLELSTKYNAEKIKIVTKVEFGTIAGTIVEYAKAAMTDMIIMGSQGSSGLHEIFVGSNAEKIVRHAPVPVLIVKDYVKGPVHDIVFPNTLDLENQEDFVMHVKQLQHFFKARLHIVWVNTPGNFTSDGVTYKRLADFTKRYMLKNFTTQVFNHNTEEGGILAYTKMVKGNMIAMATHGRKGIAHLLNGSLAEDVANHADKLIWTYRLKDEPVVA